MANITNVQGGFAACGTSYSLKYTCTGSNCDVLSDFPNATCTGTAETILSCDNGITCPGGSGYTSTFNYTQSNGLVSQSQSIDLGACGSFLVSSDGTTGGTTTSVTNMGESSCNTTLTNSTLPISSSSSSTSSLTSQTSVSSLSTGTSTSSELPGVSSSSTSPKTSSSPGPPGTPTPSKNGTTISPPIQTVTKSYGVATVRPPSMQVFFLCLILGMFFLVQGAAALAEPDALPLPAHNSEALFSPAELAELNAKSLDIIDRSLQERDGASDAKIWTEVVSLLAEYVGGKLNTILSSSNPCKSGFAQNFLAEIENAVCVKAGGQVINAVLGADLAGACTTAILAGAVLDPPAELIAIFTAGVACNFMVSYLYSHTPILSDITQFVDFVCSQPQPCGDLLTDPNNCGCCGNVVSISNVIPTKPSYPSKCLLVIL
jgi:hypothetical protein